MLKAFLRLFTPEVPEVPEKSQESLAPEISQERLDWDIDARHRRELGLPPDLAMWRDMRNYQSVLEAAQKSYHFHASSYLSWKDDWGDWEAYDYCHRVLGTKEIGGA